MIKPTGALSYPFNILPTQFADFDCFGIDDENGNRFVASLLKTVPFFWASLQGGAPTNGPIVGAVAPTPTFDSNGNLTALVLRVTNNDAAISIAGRLYVVAWAASAIAL